MVETDVDKLAAELQTLIGNGRLPEAVRKDARVLYERLQTPDHDVIDLSLKLAVLYRRCKRFGEAARLCGQVLGLQPHNAMAHHISGSVQQCLGNHDAAIASYRTAIALDATLAEAHYFLGNILQMTGQARDAAESYRKAVELKPDYLEALSNLGAVLMALHRFGEAKHILERAYRLYPDCAQVLCNLGDLVLTEDDFEKARFYAKSALKTDPRFFDAHHLLGKICRQQGDYGGTLKHFRRALEIQPNNENLIGSMAEILEKRGQFDEARELLQPLIRRGSTNPLVLKAYSALSRNLGEERKAVRLLENTLRQERMDISRKISLHSELGKQYDRLQDYPRAFEHYRQANLLERELKLQPGGRPGTGFPAVREIDGWFERFGADYWKRLPRSTTGSERPVFVVGMPRSGTTLTEQILASHPAVHGAGELPDIPDLAAKLGERGMGADRFRHLANLGKQELDSAARQYLRTLKARSPGALRVVDKMPTNFWYLGLISLLFPNARIIHLKRDPRDTCLSMYFQRFGATMTFTTDLGELAAYHSAYARTMKYWESVLDIDTLEIQYEELVDDQERVIRRMIDYCGLDWDDRCLHFHETSRDVHTPSYDQVRQPMYRKSVGRWKHYEAQLAPLISALGLSQ